MATEAVVTSRFGAVVAFMRDSYHEIRYKSTWPELKQVQEASVAIIIFVLFIGLVISLLDFVLSAILVSLIPSLLS